MGLTMPIAGRPELPAVTVVSVKAMSSCQALEHQALDRLAIPPKIRKPVTFAGVASIDEAQHAAMSAVADYQGKYFSAGIKVAVLSSEAAQSYQVKC
jgi:hypothetical protein